MPADYEDTNPPFPLNRLIAFAGPYIAIVSGGAANWLLLHVHFLATFHINQSSAAGIIAQAIVFLVSTAVVYAGQHHWLTGWQKWESGFNSAGTLLTGTLGHTDSPPVDSTPEPDGVPKADPQQAD